MISVLLFPSVVRRRIVIKGGCMSPHAGDHHAVQSGIGLSVATAVKPVPVCLPLDARIGHAPHNLVRVRRNPATCSDLIPAIVPS